MSEIFKVANPEKKLDAGITSRSALDAEKNKTKEKKESANEFKVTAELDDKGKLIMDAFAIRKNALSAKNVDLKKEFTRLPIGELLSRQSLESTYIVLKFKGVSKKVTLRSFIKKLSTESGNDGSILYNHDSKAGKLEKGSDIGKLIQLYASSRGISVRDGNKTTNVNSIDGNFKDNSLNALIHLKDAFNKEDDYMKSAFVDMKKSLEDDSDADEVLRKERNMSLNMDHYPAVALSSYGFTGRFKMTTGKVVIIAKDGTAMELPKNFVKALVKNKDTDEFLTDADANKDVFHKVMLLTNVINRSRFLSKKAEDKTANNANPFYSDGHGLISVRPMNSINPDYVRYDDNSLLSRDEPLLKDANLATYLKPFDMSISEFVDYLNNIHKRDYTVLPKSKMTDNSKAQKI